MLLSMEPRLDGSFSAGAPTRRHFLGRSSLAAAALGNVAAAKSRTMKPSVSARSAARVVGANDRINVGMIGTGGMGTAHLRSFVRQSEETKDIQVVAVCDVYARRKENARKIGKLAEKDVHHDYRELLARNDVDAVLIATPDHWHGQMALDAMLAGKDVYLQKPMTYTIEEARQLAETARKQGRILQVGSQGLSDPRVHKIKELIGQGEIGELLWAQATASRNSLLGEWNWRIDKEGTPETIDWNRWLGPAPKRPFSAERYFRWRKYWDYSGGIATDLYYHSLGPVLFAMGAEFPVSVTAAGGIYVQKDREVPDTYATLIEYPNFYITLSGSMANEAGGKYHPMVIYGHKGSIVFERGRIVVLPESPMPGTFDKRTEPPKPAKTYEVEAARDSHRARTDNFFACMRSRKAPNLDADFGYKVMTAIRLGVDSYRERKVKLFDARTERVVSSAPARPAWEGDGKNHEDEFRKPAAG
jgi:predicted dehydrogenase